MSSSSPPATALSPPATNSTSPPPLPPPPPADAKTTSSTPPTESNATTPLSPETPATSPPPPPPPNSNGSLVPSPSPSSADGGLSTGTLVGLILGVVLGAVLVLIGVGIFVFFYRRKKRKHAEALPGNPPPPPPGPPKVVADFSMLPKPSPPPGIALNPHQSPVKFYPSAGPSSDSSLSSEKLPFRSPFPGTVVGFSQSTFTYEELATATDSFSSGNLVGQGGFGYVYKGILSNGKVVAIKQLKAGSGQGECEFQAEIEIINRVHHRHLVSLVGYCIAGSQRMLVYEFIANNTLEFHLHGKGRPVMNWPTRMKIALGAAKGLAYLHEDCQPKIIHRDIKAANILLDNTFEAKVADFGLAKSTLDSDTHVSTRVMGTFGYLAPEYASSGKLTDKSDVFSFGVVLLELLTGRRPVDKTQPFADDSIVDWAKPLLVEALEDGNFEALVDPKLKNDYDPHEVTQMVACAAASVRHSAKCRPRMSQIVRALEGSMSLADLNEGTKPGHRTVFSSFESSDYTTAQYRENLQKFRKMALESQVQF